MAKLFCTGSGSSGNAYAIETENGEILLLECGVNWNKILRMIHFNVIKVSGCLVSHRHKDHSASFVKVLQDGIPVYTNDETADYFEVSVGEKMIGKPEKIPFSCGSFTITPFYLPHTMKAETNKIIPCPNYGYMVQQEEMGTLLYMTDMEYCPFSFRNLKVQHLAVECNYIDSMVDREQGNYVHRLQGHCSLETCKGIIKENMTPALRTITLLHLSDEACDEEQVLQEIRGIVNDRVAVNIAHTGLEVELNKFPF